MHAGFDERTLGESRKSSWPRTIREAMRREDKDLWEEAILKEAKSVLSKGTIKDAKWIRGVSTKPLPLMWVLTVKYKEDGSVEKYKARLVVLGNQQNFGSAAAGDVAAPVTRFTTARMLLAVANSSDERSTKWTL